MTQSGPAAPDEGTSQLLWREGAPGGPCHFTRPQLLLASLLNKSSALISFVGSAGFYWNVRPLMSLSKGSSTSRITFVSPSAYLNVAGFSCSTSIVSMSFTYSLTAANSSGSSWNASPAKCDDSVKN